MSPSLWEGKAVIGGSESDSSFYNDDQRIGIFDATCDNFILSQGVPIPVDVVIVEVGNLLRVQLL